MTVIRARRIIRAERIFMKKDDLSIMQGRERSGLLWLPDNVAQYFNENHTTIDISVCNTDVEQGYGVRITKCLRILRPFCRCNNCGYHSLWNPDDTESKCRRHTYTKGWDTVFSYTLEIGEHKMSLEKAFDEFLKRQPDRLTLPVIRYRYQYEETVFCQQYYHFCKREWHAGAG